MPAAWTQSACLDVLCRTPAENLKTLANQLLPELERLGSLEVLQNRTGLVMLPYRDTVQGTQFFLGEVLVAEGHVRLTPSVEASLSTDGYGAILGRDLEAALSVALIDLSVQLGVNEPSLTAFLEREKTVQDGADELLWRKVESTRVQMETF